MKNRKTLLCVLALLVFCFLSYFLNLHLLAEELVLHRISPNSLSFTNKCKDLTGKSITLENVESLHGYCFNFENRSFENCTPSHLYQKSTNPALAVLVSSSHSEYYGYRCEVYDDNGKAKTNSYYYFD